MDFWYWQSHFCWNPDFKQSIPFCFQSWQPTRPLLPTNEADEHAAEMVHTLFCEITRSLPFETDANVVPVIMCRRNCSCITAWLEAKLLENHEGATGSAHAFDLDIGSKLKFQHGLYPSGSVYSGGTHVVLLQIQFKSNWHQKQWYFSTLSAHWNFGTLLELYRDMPMVKKT